MREIYEYNDADEAIVLDGFISDDGEHQVIWKDGWFCETHSKDYFKDCLESEKPKSRENQSPPFMAN